MEEQEKRGKKLSSFAGKSLILGLKCGKIKKKSRFLRS